MESAHARGAAGDVARLAQGGAVSTGRDIRERKVEEGVGRAELDEPDETTNR